jgi:trigger factor
MRLVSFKKDGNKAKAVFSIDNSEFEDKVNIVWNRQKKWFRVPGFRKGKVPRGIIENEYGKDIFYDAALSLLYPKMVDLLLEETKEKIITIEGELYMSISSEAKPQIVNKDENSVETQMEVNIYPKVDIDYNNVQVAIEPKKEVSEEEIQAQLNAAQKRMGNRHMDAQTKVQDNDVVRFDIEKIEPLTADGKVDKNDQSFKKIKKLRGFKIKVGSGPIENSLKNHNAAEGAFQSEFEFPKELPNKDIAGKKVRAELKILAVKRAYDMPEVAEKNGFDNLDAFKNFIKEKIDKHHQSVYENDKKSKMVEKIVSMVGDDLVSDNLLKGKITLVKNQYRKIAESIGQSPEALIESFGGEDEFNKKITDIVKMDLKGLIAFHSIADKEGMKFSDAEIEKYAEELKAQGMPTDGVSKAEIIDRMVGEKVIELLMSKVKFVDKAQSENPEEPDITDDEQENEDDTSSEEVSKNDGNEVSKDDGNEDEDVPESKRKVIDDASGAETDVEDDAVEVEE